MGAVLFHPIADGDQDEIYRWTAENWGEGQAVAYLTGLHAHLQLLAQSPGLWRPLSSRLTVLIKTDEPIYVTRYRMHYVFFRRLPEDGLGVLRLFDVRRDMPRKLRRELIQMARDPLQ
ncbi:plasmid stabilization system protein ParE [Peteryoungia aggregata LMG 23059]|uniref:Plasmid stabilization system protein ParE n=1 Tax=Peteryoungia aggregata LMG 23059 TaxID=1368425 RepID=A0ABU0GEA7_9HYPH|nr:type II toxin-antitoxin system RelE/ParE family toxin [Peteryoungia aggregata]MDQ0422935.1 plasmid stabilization system protein ParE [Peteryoungia aggregata LMG 23059]